MGRGGVSMSVMTTARMTVRADCFLLVIDFFFFFLMTHLVFQASGRRSSVLKAKESPKCFVIGRC